MCIKFSFYFTNLRPEEAPCRNRKKIQAIFEKINFGNFAIRTHVKICNLLTSKQYHQSDSMKSISLQVINTIPRKVHAQSEKKLSIRFLEK